MGKNEFIGLHNTLTIFKLRIGYARRSMSKKLHVAKYRIMYNKYEIKIQYSSHFTVKLSVLITLLFDEPFDFINFLNPNLGSSQLSKNPFSFIELWPGKVCKWRWELNEDVENKIFTLFSV